MSAGEKRLIITTLSEISENLRIAEKARNGNKIFFKKCALHHIVTQLEYK